MPWLEGAREGEIFRGWFKQNFYELRIGVKVDDERKGD